MKIIDLKTGEEVSLSEGDRVAAALGNFDGVHLGHRALLKRAASLQAGETKSAVWTFAEPSSRLVGGISLLTDPEERFALFREMGIDLVFLADFEAVRGYSPEAFVREILYQACHVRRAVCGFNFRFGAKAAGTAETLQAQLSALGGEAEVVPPFMMGDKTVSSSEIRRLLSEGAVERAGEMLARPYALTGKVLHGKKLGSTLGFPTANQAFPPHRAVPRFGVYIVRVTVDGKTYGGVANVGLRPTVEHSTAVNAETYLLDFAGELYGKTVKTEFLHFLRPEKRFSSVEALTAAVQENIREAEAYFARRNENR